MRHSTAIVALAFACLFIFGAASASARGTDTAPPGKSVTPQATDPFNGRISVAVGADARFSEGAFPDSSTGVPAPGSYTTLYGWPSTGTSFSTVRVDGNDAIFGTAPGVLVQSPTDTNPSTNISTWTFGGVSVTQNLSIVTNPDTGQLDTAQISYTATNTDVVAHDVGLRIMLDTDVNSNDGAPFRIPGVGPVTTEQDLSGSAIPDTFQVYADLADSQHIAAARLRGAGTTPPDRLVIAAWPSIRSTLYDYTPSGQAITSDSAYAAFWNPISLAPGQSRTVSTDYGLSDVTVDLTPPLAVGLSGPATVGVSSNAYTPNPFAITATVADAGSAVATGATLTLNLPPGLHTSDPMTVSVGDLAAGGPEQQVSWEVTADPQASQLVANYSVTASASNATSKTVSRTITIPALTVARACSDATFIAVIGSGQVYSSPTDLSVSPQLQYLYAQLVARLGNQKSIQPLVENYVALSVNTITAGLADINDRNPATRALHLERQLGTNVQTYLNGKNAGLQQLRLTVSAQLAACPNTRLVLAGYSQGAMIVHEYLTELARARNTAVSSTIVGVGLIADPDHVHDSAVTEFSSAPYDSSGVCYFLRRFVTCTTPLTDIPTMFLRRTVSVCRFQDPVCDTSDVVHDLVYTTSAGRHTLVSNLGVIHSSYRTAPETRSLGQFLAHRVAIS